MRLSALLLAVIVASGCLNAAQLDAKLSPQDANIGDRLMLDLRVQGAPPATVQFALPDAEHFTLLSIDSSAMRTENRIRYSLAIYDTGNYVLPEIPVVIRTGAVPETLFTPQLAVTIHSVVPDTATAVLPLKPYREHPFRWNDVWRAVRSSKWTWIGLAVVLMGISVWIWRKKFVRKPIVELKPELMLSAHEQATRDLIALKDKRYPQRGMLKEFFSEYSQIMRNYLERRYEFPALEMTTFDLEMELVNDRFPTVLSRQLLPTLHEADLVKFAKYIPRPETCDDLLDTGFELVSMTKAQDVSPDETIAA